MGWVIKIVLVTIPVLFGLTWNGAFDFKSDPPQMKDGWWGRGPPKAATDQDVKIRKFTVPYEEADVTDLQRRLNASRISASLEGGTFQYGTQSSFLQDTVLPYWRNKYDWKKAVQKLNSYEHFKTRIEGIDIHFIRIKPTTGNVKPLLMIHGWPGSVYEFYKAIPLMVTPQNDDNNVFELVLPSLPGYGYSEASHQPGLDAVDIARMFKKLMQRLGHEQFYVQGGDWGGTIGTIIAKAYPQHVLGLHANMLAIQPMSIPSVMLKQLVGAFFPSLVLAEDQISKVYPILNFLKDGLMETGYFHIQATKPDTIGTALGDSPIGLAAYILEKYSIGTNKTYRDLADGGLLRHWSLDDLLTNVMIYWTTNTITSSMRLYKETVLSDKLPLYERVAVVIPTGVACFPGEVVLYPRSFIEPYFPNLVHYTDLPAGGHFAAFQEPKLFVEDFRTFIIKIN